MYLLSILKDFGFWFTLFLWSSTVTALPPNHSPVSARSNPSSRDVARHPNPYLPARGYVQADHHSSLVPRIPFKNAPGLPPGWVATYSITSALLPIQYSARQLEVFYYTIIQAMEDDKEFPDKFRQTIQIGQLALVFLTGVKGKKLVTKQIIIATAMMLLEYTRGGFEDLFAAKLMNDEYGTSVFIQLRVVDRKE
ncbi:MAG: hypothetical protein LQ352_006366 [Teloschistes flavicans]|nr:MAG: hypothetical protein LQ352_006366 [Teloschistes flavicans]